MDLFSRLNHRMAATLSVLEPAECLPGRSQPIVTAEIHQVLGTQLKAPFPAHAESIVFGLGCFWGAERTFWQLDGVLVTAVGYSGGHTPNPTYEEVCSGNTGHTEAVLVVYDPAVISQEGLLRHFWQAHDPCQGMRQGNDVGTQYRSAIYVSSEEQRKIVEASRECYGERLETRGFGGVTTEIAIVGTFYYAEEYHQQYLAKHPNGYCGLGGTGVNFD